MLMCSSSDVLSALLAIVLTTACFVLGSGETQHLDTGLYVLASCKLSFPSFHHHYGLRKHKK